MEVVVHGTKGGYRILFKTPGAPSIGSDIRNNVSSEAAIGKSAYSIAFAANGCVFTKYIIIRDTLRSDATGFIAFSLFLLSNKELPNKGVDVKSILDELSNHYMDNYVRNYSINKGETNIIQEDWSFVNNISDRKKELDKNRNDIEIQAGTKEAAFIFYEDDSKLQEYFSKPFQEEYNGYKQILLISGDLRNSSADLLNALRNSGIGLEVDLKDEYFFLTDCNRSRGLTISANKKPRSEGKNNNAIRAKEMVEIKYTKDYFEPIEVTGTLSNLASDIYKYLERRGTQIIIKYDALSKDLKPIEKIITFDIKDWKGNPIRDAEIICKSSIESKSVINNQISFQGEEIGQQWNVSAKKEDNFFSDTKKIIPENGSYVTLVLNEHKKVKFVALDSDTGQNIINFKIWIQGKIDTREISEVEFIGNEVEKKWNITFEKQGYHRSERIEYFPATGASTIQGNLKKKDPQLGQSKENVPHPQHKRKEPFYQKSKLMAALIAGTILLIFAIGAFFSLRKSNPPEPNQQPDVQRIKAYIEGNSLILDTLFSYKKILSSGTQPKEVIDSLDSATKKREYINKWNFDELKKLHYYPAQQNFDTAIQKINSSQYDSLKSRFGGVSSWDLNQIADSINAFLNSTKPATEKKEVKKDVAEEIKEEPQKKETKQANTKQKNEEKQVSIPASTNNSRDISKELQSDAVTRNDLQSWKSGGIDKYKKSIDLYLDFWASIKQGMQMDDSRQLLKKINDDKYLQKSALQSFLKSVCANSESFKKYNDTPGKAACKTLNELRSKVK